MQRQIDDILKKYRHFVKAYVDDIVIFFNFLKKHLKHLNQIFALFKKYNIVIKVFKTYFEYFLILLLKQHVDNFELSTIKKKNRNYSRTSFFSYIQKSENILEQNGIFASIYRLLCSKNRTVATKKKFDF